MNVLLHKPLQNRICFFQSLAFLQCVIVFGVVLIVSLGGVHLAHAETLNKALASAYDTNPTLQAERARLRATDEGVEIGRAHV